MFLVALSPPVESGQSWDNFVPWGSNLRKYIHLNLEKRLLFEVHCVCHVCVSLKHSEIASRWVGPGIAGMTAAPAAFQTNRPF